ncbi:TetR family transcriptional regulator [Stackebrandtia albiflava]|uniref:TetR family transcriptional regulator n=1 Tax=Stackebrandtia albiflava TaxID=406432 RepID=A0A562VEQ7_9ACTN|nr:TetR/AcrR family transcriptional regulator [Stackebrandtia albiflava]TWJ16369.1 TetR family transcriptional regulator [Stackebrandtia albiflava]
MTDTRTRLLDAATDVLLHDGAQSLTLEAVAARAGVSKGGLFYHFPTKQALAEAMVDRFVAEFTTALTEAGDRPGAATRAYLRACVSETHPGPGTGRAAAALFAAALVEPAALEPLRRCYDRWQHRLEDDGIDPAVATTVRLAADGWWLARLAGLAAPSPGRHEEVFAQLSALVDEAAEA